ncbi:MAG: uracil phosphoribosyltransferase [Acidimicrobiales bacterium]|nr:uracil phosphoribosyltransferase [Acidimicrobiales bacterium]
MDDTPLAAGAMAVTVVDHPLAAQLLARLRDETTDRAGFRRAMDDLSGILVYEAARHMDVAAIEVRTPLGVAAGVQVRRPPLVVPVLRAGLGMLGGALRHLPETDTGFVGLARNEETLEPESYMNSVPDELDGRPVLVLDPMLATGGSLDLTCRLLAGRNAGPLTAVCVLAAPEGVERLRGSGLVRHVVTASIDSHLDERAYIFPGLGDAGDRLFGTA